MTMSLRQKVSSGLVTSTNIVEPNNVAGAPVNAANDLVSQHYEGDPFMAQQFQEVLRVGSGKDESIDNVAAV